VKLRYTFRLRPGAAAERALWQEAGRCRWVWNQAAAARKNRTAKFDDKSLTAARREHEWLRAGSSVAQKQALRDFYSKKATGKHSRKFRSRRDQKVSLNYTRNGFALKPDVEGRIRLVVAGGIVLPVVWSRELPSAPSSVRVYRDAVGHWWASFVVEREHAPLPPSNDAIGIDWGVSQIATTTDPAYDLPHPKLGRKHAAQLAAAQRRMARRKPARFQPASKGYKRAKRQAAVIHEHVRNARREEARKWARRVVLDHGYIAIEDFRPTFMMRNKKLSRAAADAAVSLAKRILIEYAQRDGRTVVMIDPAYTTMDCSACGARAKTRLSLSERTYDCHSCGARLDRDLNAARNIALKAGFNLAGADGVRQPGHPTGSQAAA